MNKFETAKDFSKNKPLDFLKQLMDLEKVQKDAKLLELIKKIIKIIKKNAKENMFNHMLSYIPFVKKTENAEEFNYQETQGFEKDIKTIFNALEISEDYFDLEKQKRYEILKAYLIENPPFKGKSFEDLDVSLSPTGDTMKVINPDTGDCKKFSVFNKTQSLDMSQSLKREKVHTLLTDPDFCLQDLDDYVILNADSILVKDFNKMKYEYNTELKEVQEDAKNVEETNIVESDGYFYNKDTGFLTFCDHDKLLNSKYYDKETYSLTVPEEIDGVRITNFNDGCFKNFYQVKEILIEGNNIPLSRYMFDNCVQLENVVLPNNICQIPKGCFRDCENLFSIELPKTITNICTEAFMNCSSLIEIEELPELKSISDCAFSGCSNLNNFTFNDKLAYLGYDAFFGCDFHCVDLGRTRAVVHDRAFGMNRNLNEVYLPESDYVVQNAFVKCPINKYPFTTMLHGPEYDNEELHDAIVNMFNGKSKLQQEYMNKLNTEKVREEIRQMKHDKKSQEEIEERLKEIARTIDENGKPIKKEPVINKEVVIDKEEPEEPKKDISSTEKEVVKKPEVEPIVEVEPKEEKIIDVEIKSNAPKITTAELTGISGEPVEREKRIKMPVLGKNRKM